jgi:myo-inositol-1(or 4)-monophosphatase
MDTPSETLLKWQRTAIDAADAAATVHRRWAGLIDVGAARRKGTADYVSRADLESQDAVLRLLRARHPDHAILAEEGSENAPPTLPPTDRPLWIVDPLDGTTNFLHGHPTYAASVAVAVSGRVVAGAVSCAATGERWWASTGGGAWKNGRPIHVSAVDTLSEALVGTGFPFKSHEHLDAYAAQLVTLLRATGGVRRGGAAAVDLCYLAEGRFDAFWELFLNPWDFAAGIVIVQEAGGVLARVGQEPLELTPGSVAAANGAALQADLQALLAAAAPLSARSSRSVRS